MKSDIRRRCFRESRVARLCFWRRFFVTEAPEAPCIPLLAAESAVAVAPSAMPTATSGEGESARVVAADAVGTVVSSAVIEGILGKWGVELPPVLVSRPPSETAAFLGRSCRPRSGAGGASALSPLAPRHHQRPGRRPPAEAQTDDNPAGETARLPDADETTYDSGAERHLGADLDDDDDDGVQLPSPSPTGLRGDPRDPGHWTGAFEAFAASPIDDQVLTGDADGDGGPSANGALTDVQLHERRLDDLFDKLSMAPYYVVRRTSTKVRHAELVGRTTHDPFTSLPRLFFLRLTYFPYSLPLRP